MDDEKDLMNREGMMGTWVVYWVMCLYLILCRYEMGCNDNA